MKEGIVVEGKIKESCKSFVRAQINPKKGASGEKSASYLGGRSC